MAKDTGCTKCGSLDIISNAILQPDAHGGHVLVWRGSKHSTISARVCGKCGYTKLYVTKPETLLSAQKK